MLLNLIDHLPSHTHFFSAMSQDEEYAEMVLDAQERGETSAGAGPSLTTWTPEVNALATVIDKLETVRMSVVGGFGGKPGEFIAYPRPKTAIDKVRHRRRVAQHESLVARLVPRQ